MQKLYPFLLALVCLSACTPLRVLRLEPAPEEIDSYLYGNAVATVTVGDAEVSASFYDATQEVVVFHLEVANKGTEPFDYDPASAFLQSPDGTLLEALDPEIQLLTADLDYIRRVRTQRVVAGLTVAAAVGGAVALASSDGAAAGAGDVGTVSNGVDRVGAYTDLGFLVIDATSAAVLSGRDTPNPDDVPATGSRPFWLEHAMRLTTIKPGEVAVGKLVFPRTLVEGRFELAVPVGDGVGGFGFDQRVYRR